MVVEEKNKSVVVGSELVEVVNELMVENGLRVEEMEMKLVFVEELMNDLKSWRFNFW